MADKKTTKADQNEVLDENEVEIFEEIEEIQDKDFDKNEIVEFKGKYVKAIGRRKLAVAQVRLYEKGKGAIVVNGMKLSKYFPGDALGVVIQPLRTLSKLRDFNFSVIVKGGGKKGQADATRLGISRALLALDEANRDSLKVNGFLTRDPRRKERKKPGLKKARKRPQWSKR